MSAADDAASVLAPREGFVTVTSNTAATASAAIAHGAGSGQYVAISVDDGSTSDCATAKFWVTFGDSGVGAPVTTATTGDTRCFGPYEGVTHLKPHGSTHYRVMVSGSGTFYIRSYPSSHGGTR